MAAAPIRPAPALAIVDPVIRRPLATQVGHIRLATSGMTIPPPGGKKRRGGRKPPRHRRNRSKIGLSASAEAGRTRRAGPAGARAAGPTRAGGLRLHRQQALALQLLARQLAGATDRL